MTFAAPTPDLLERDDNWPWPGPRPGTFATRQLPPPPPGAVPIPGPAPWTLLTAVEHLDVGRSRRPADVVVGLEVADAFELIWPTGEIDEQFLGGPLSEMPSPGLAFAEGPPRAIDPSAATLPMTVRLRQLMDPTEVLEPPRTEPVSDDVVRAIQRAIAAIGSELAVVDEPQPAPRLPEPTTGMRHDPCGLGTPDSSAPTATEGHRITTRSPFDPADERRSALRRLISGLRRR